MRLKTVIALVICQFTIIPMLILVTANTLRHVRHDNLASIVNDVPHVTTVYRTAPN